MFKYGILLVALMGLALSQAWAVNETKPDTSKETPEQKGARLKAENIAKARSQAQRERLNKRGAQKISAEDMKILMKPPKNGPNEAGLPSSTSKRPESVRHLDPSAKNFRANDHLGGAEARPQQHINK